MPYVRIDFIEWHDSVKFREITFTSGTGLSQIRPIEYSKTLGDWIKLPETAYNVDTKEYYKLQPQNNICYNNKFRKSVKKHKYF